MKEFIKTNIPWLIASIISLFSVGFSYYNNYSDKREDEAETARCNVLIARQETDLNKLYFQKEGLEIRHTNNNAGHFWFVNQYIKEVYFDPDADDFFVKHDNCKMYLSIKHGKHKH